MKLKEILSEEWITSVNLGDKAVEFFKNPTPREMNAAKGRNKFIRFFAYYPTKTVYVWNERILHHRVCKIIGIIGNFSDYSEMDNVIGGTAKRVKGKWICDSVHNIDSHGKTGKEKVKKILETNWGWVSKYIDLEYCLRKYKKANKII